MRHDALNGARFIGAFVHRRLVLVRNGRRLAEFKSRGHPSQLRSTTNKHVTILNSIRMSSNYRPSPRSLVIPQGLCLQRSEDVADFVLRLGQILKFPLPCRHGHECLDADGHLFIGVQFCNQGPTFVPICGVRNVTCRLGPTRP